MNETDLERRVLETGRELYQLLGDGKPSAFKKDYWSGRMLEWCVRDEAFKVEMFRFVDVYPYLHTAEDVARHLQEYFGRPGQNLPLPFKRRLFSLSPNSFASKIAARAVGSNIRSMASQFIAGETPKEAAPTLRGLRREGAAHTIALLGEAVVSEAEAEDYFERYLNVLDTLETEKAVSMPFGDGDLDWGVTPQVNVSVKATALYSQLRPLAFDRSVDAAKARLTPILRKAVSRQAFINFDMEHRELKNLTLTLYRSILEEPEFRGYPHTGIAVQAYLLETLDDLGGLLDWSLQHDQPVTIRLIKGAYWDQEVIHAQQNGWPVPVFTNKDATDANFERAARLILSHDAPARLACGSHNIRSIAYVKELAREFDADVEFQALHGMADPVKRALLSAGMPTRMYVPVGKLLPGMAYLVRRLLENTSNESFLLRSFAIGDSPEELLRKPDARVSAEAPCPSPAEDGFRNEPPLDWTLEENRSDFAQALAAVRSRAPARTGLFLNGEEVSSGQQIESVNPSNPDETVAIVSSATVEHAEQAVAAARDALPKWRATDPSERAALLFRAAQLARESRLELAAQQVLEVGKTWDEADGDVCEAIDFLNFYGREMLRLGDPKKLAETPGEDSRLLYEPRGVAAVIAPWNFPLAISTGMTAAALVAGNTVVYKPAEESAGVGAGMVRIFREAGVPPGVLNFLPGDGPRIGGFLVAHADVALIAFTGSMEVGLEIVRRCAETPEGQRGVKKVIAEMGGKNAIIIDTDADFDLAVRDVIHSAFSFQGQKCSACSRLILPEAIHDRFLERLIPAIKSIPIGLAEDPSTHIGPVVSREARQKVERYIEIGREEGTVTLQLNPAQQDGHFVPITVLTNIAPHHRVAQEEIFGPVLSVIKVKDFSEALEVANSTRFALTGAVFSRSPRNIETARRRFQVGNLYINRSCTGALVERHPFGGFKLSGLGSKAGGEDYLREFLVARTITENTVRQGFAPPD